MADLQKQLDNTYKHAAQLMTTTLEFRGSKVWLGQAEGSFEYDYEVTGSELILRANISGQPVRVAMRLMDDGSIEYLGLRFKKVR